MNKRIENKIKNKFVKGTKADIIIVDYNCQFKTIAVKLEYTNDDSEVIACVGFSSKWEETVCFTENFKKLQKSKIVFFCDREEMIKAKKLREIKISRELIHFLLFEDIVDVAKKLGGK